MPLGAIMTVSLLPQLSARLNQPKIHRLANGLTIIAESVPVEAVNLSLWLNVGSAQETDEINGMAHFLEHMIFKGTTQLASGEFEGLIEGRGAVTNAATSQDYTHYYITTAPQDFAELAPYQVDVVLNASIPDTAFEQERSVVLEEIRRSDDNPRRRTFQHLMELAFTRLPYRRSVLGPEHVIAQLTAAQMRTFHQTRYTPTAMTAVAVGNLPTDQLIEIVADAFEQKMIRRSQTPAVSSPPIYDQELPFDSIVRQEFIDPQLQQARLVILWRVPGLNHQSRLYALDVLASILGQGRTSRLTQTLKEQAQWVTSVSASHLNYQTQGVFYIAAQLPTENIPVVEAAIVNHLSELQNTLVTETELARVRRQVANRFVFGNETPSDRASLYGYYHAMFHDLEPALRYSEQIQAVGAEAVQRVAQQYLSPTAYGLIVIKPN
jgi:zinc protease